MTTSASVLADTSLTDLKANKGRVKEIHHLFSQGKTLNNSFENSLTGEENPKDLDVWPEIKKIHSRVHTRVLIQTGSTTQRKTFTYHQDVPTEDHLNNNSKSTNFQPTDTQLDNMAVQMGLLKISRPPQSNGHESSPWQSSHNGRSSSNHLSSKLRLHQLSPHEERRSKSSSPSRSHLVKLSEEDVQHRCQATAVEVKKSSRHSSSSNPLRRIFNTSRNILRHGTKHSSKPSSAAPTSTPANNSDSIKEDDDDYYSVEENSTDNIFDAGQSQSTAIPKSSSCGRLTDDVKVSSMLVQPAHHSPFSEKILSQLEECLPVSSTVPSYIGIALSAFGYTSHLPKMNDLSSQKVDAAPNAALSPPDQLNIEIEDINQSKLTIQTSPMEVALPADLTRMTRSLYSKPHPIESPSQEDSFEVMDSTTFYTLGPRSASGRPAGCGGRGSARYADPNCCSPSAADRGVEMRRKRSYTIDIKVRSSSDEKSESRQRASLIMMSVAQSSPRGKFFPQMSEDLGHFGGAGLSFDSAVAINKTFGEPGSPMLSSIRESPPLHHAQPATSPEEGQRRSLAAVLVEAQKQLAEEQIPTTVHDGHYFLDVLKSNEISLSKKIQTIQLDLAEALNCPQLDPEVEGHLRTTIGKAYLLLNDKFGQFRGLCEQNLAEKQQQQQQPISGTPQLRTLDSDLEGFWEMVELQVADVDRLFQLASQYRLAGWTVQASEVPEKSSTTSTNSRSTARRTNPTTTTTSTGAPQMSEAAVQRAAESRRRLMAAKREAMLKFRQQQQQAHPITDDQLDQ